MLSIGILMKKKKSKLLVAKKQGFITTYGLILLYVVLLFTSFITTKLKSQILYGERLSFAELRAIEYAKSQILLSTFENQQFIYENLDISIMFYEGYCEIMVTDNQNHSFQSKLAYDDETKEITGYDYFR
ncbi:hypothetical protein M2475_000673 [Breznakia sp. PF5-3]|nr:hypothetical protein [Breznakia sp. PM6-1]MDF9835112.1 hypothetical protein [Breznakia sp. PF5-3]